MEVNGNDPHLTTSQTTAQEIKTETQQSLSGTALEKIASRLDHHTQLTLLLISLILIRLNPIVMFVVVVRLFNNTGS